MHTLRVSIHALTLEGVSYSPSLIAHVTNRNPRKRQERRNARRLRRTELHRPLQKILIRTWEGKGTKVVRPRVLHVQTRLGNDTQVEMPKFGQ